MARVKVGISDLSIPELMPVCAEIITKMTGNAFFPTPNPKLPEIGDALKALNDAYQAAIYGGKLLKGQMYLAEKTLRTQMMQLGAYVQNASDGDEARILTSGMLVAEKRGAPQPVGTPQNLIALHSDGFEDAPVEWEPTKGARAYCIQQTTTPDVETSWTITGIAVKSKFHVTELEKAKEYWFRVAAVGSLGQGQWSDPVKRMLG